MSRNHVPPPGAAGAPDGNGMRATIKSIAEKTGFSVGTVDRVLHKRGGVNARTAARIEQAAREFGYQSNLAGKALACQRYPMYVCVVANSAEYNRFAGEILDGVASAAAAVAAYGLHVEYRLMDSFSAGEQASILDALDARRLSGLLIKPVNHPDIARRIGRFVAGGLPVVTFTSDIRDSGRLCFVGHDQIREGRMAASLMCKMLGPRARVALITGSQFALSHHLKTEAFVDYAGRARPDLRIAGTFEVHSRSAAAVDVIGEVCATGPLDGLFIQSLDKRGVVELCRTLPEPGKTLVCTFGALRDVEELVRSGAVAFAIEESPFRQGAVALHTLFDALFHKKRPADEFVEVETRILVDASLGDADGTGAPIEGEAVRA